MATDTLDLLPDMLSGSMEIILRSLQRTAGQQLSPRASKFLLRHFRYTLSIIRGLWRKSRRALLEGAEATAFLQECGRAIGSIESYSYLLHKFEGAIQAQPQTAGRRQRLAELEAMAVEASRIRAAYQRWTTSFSCPTRDIDWQAVADAEAAHARGEHRTATDFEAAQVTERNA